MKANQAEPDAYPVKTMSRVLGVSTSGYYAWRERLPSKRALDDAALLERIKAIHRASDDTYGMPKIHAELHDSGDAHYDARWARVGRHRIARLMRTAGLRGISRRRGFTVTTRRDENARAAPDLVKREFTARGPNELWVSDLTYVLRLALFHRHGRTVIRGIWRA
jgi:putative transposase